MNAMPLIIALHLITTTPEGSKPAGTICIAVVPPEGVDNEEVMDGNGSPLEDGVGEEDLPPYRGS